MPHEGQEHLSHSVSQRAVLGTLHQGHRGGPVKSVDSAFKQTSQVGLRLGVGAGNLVTAKLRPWQRIEPEVRGAGWVPGGKHGRRDSVVAGQATAPSLSRCGRAAVWIRESSPGTAWGVLHAYCVLIEVKGGSWTLLEEGWLLPAPSGRGGKHG